MSVNKILTYDTDLSTDVGYKILHVNLVLGESNGHTINVNVLRNGTKVTDSATCSAKFLRSDGATVEFSGSFSGGVASVTLPSSCYLKEGACKLSISLSTGSTVSTIFVLIANVKRFSSTSIVASDKVIPRIDDLLANIDKLERLVGEADGLALDKVGYAEYSNGAIKMYSDSSKKYLISSVSIPSGSGTGGSSAPYDDTALKNSKVGYAEVSGTTLKLYSDSTKTKLISSVALPSGGTSGMTKQEADGYYALKDHTHPQYLTEHLTADEIRDMGFGSGDGELISVGNENVTDKTKVQINADGEEVEIPSMTEFNSLVSRVTSIELSGGSNSGTGSGITTAQAQAIIDNTNARHTHSNKSVLDGITSTKVSEWNSKSTFSGNYNDLTNKPTLFSGDYNDLINKPTIPSGGSSSGVTVSADLPYAVPEAFGAIANDSSASARAANTKAFTDAILAGYNIVCNGGTSNKESTINYYFSGMVDVRAVKYRSIDINLNGCRLCDFHIIANIVDDSAMTSTSCTWAWTNGNKFYLSIHDGLIGASTSSSEMTSLPKQPVAITGLIPRFKNLQVIGKVHICAMPPIYCDQMYFENIKLVGSADSVWDYWNDLDNICVITGKDSNGYIYKNNGDGCRLNGDQFRFTEINDGRHFFTLYENLGTIVSDCIASSFAVNNSMVKFVNCHNESGTRRTPIIHSIVRGGYTDVVLDNCYMEQHAFEVFAGMSATVLGCVSMIDCVISVGTGMVSGHNDAHACNFFENMYKLKYQHGNKICQMDRYILPRVELPESVYCTSATLPGISTNTSLTKVATGITSANFKTGTYAYTVAYHSAGALGVAVKTETKSVTISSQSTLNRFAIENYGGHMISLYKTDGTNKYRAIIPSYPTTGTFTLMIDDCGAFISLWNNSTRTTADGSYARETIKDAVLWEAVSSIPTVAVNANLRGSGRTIYDTSGKLYATNGNTITAIN